MDDEKNTRVIIPLPGVCMRVQLPLLPNFLTIGTGKGSLAIAELTRDDVTLLGMAWQRALREHWRGRVAKAERMSPPEARELSSDLLHPATANRIGRRVGCPPELVQSIMRTFTEELAHG